MKDQDLYTSSNAIGVDFTDSLGDGTHELLPSCSYKLETDENSCDSGVSMSSQCSLPTNDCITNFASLNVYTFQ